MEAKGEFWQDSEAKETKASREDAQAKDAKATDEISHPASQDDAPSKSSIQVRILMPNELQPMRPSLELSSCWFTYMCLLRHFSQKASATFPIGMAPTEF
jgi:hypothetical protein